MRNVSTRFTIYSELHSGMESKDRTFCPPSGQEDDPPSLEDCFYPSIGAAVEDCTSVYLDLGQDVSFTVRALSTSDLEAQILSWFPDADLEVNPHG